MGNQSSSEAASKDTDARLFRGFLTGNRDAMHGFISRWESSVYRISFRIVGQASDAEEVRQTVFLKMLQRPDVLPDADRVAGWIRRCVVNESITLLRRRVRHLQVDTLDEYAAPNEQPSDDAKLLKVFFAELDPRQRALLALRFDEGLTVRQIAEVMEMPRSTIHERLQAAIGSLRQHFNSCQ